MRVRRWEKARGRERRAERVRAWSREEMGAGGGDWGEVRRSERAGMSSVRMAVSRVRLSPGIIAFCLGGAKVGCDDGCHF